MAPFILWWYLIIMGYMRMQKVGALSNGIERPSLLIPEAGPSYPHLPAERWISTKASERNVGGILPVQRYRSARRQSLPLAPSFVNIDDFPSARNENQIDDYLAAMDQDPDSFDISQTSRALLAKRDSLSRDQRKKLVQKLQVEHRASQPVPLEALEILYCDAHICVTNKPSGILSVPGPRRNPSLANLVYDTLKPDIELDQMVVHRLDMATSGVLVFALTLEALSQLHLDFKERRVQKTYQALVSHDEHSSLLTSCLALEGEIDVDLERDPENPPFMRIAQPKPDLSVGSSSPEEELQSEVGIRIGKDHKFYKQAPKESLTTWSLVRREVYHGQPVSRLDLHPWTGRTHQLRVHCAQGLGAPIVGDEIYGNADDLGQTLCLHARQLCLYHPISGAPMIFEAEPPF